LPAFLSFSQCARSPTIRCLPKLSNLKPLMCSPTYLLVLTLPHLLPHLPTHAQSAPPTAPLTYSCSLCPTYCPTYLLMPTLPPLLHLLRSPPCLPHPTPWPAPMPCGSPSPLPPGEAPPLPIPPKKPSSSCSRAVASHHGCSRPFRHTKEMLPVQPLRQPLRWRCGCLWLKRAHWCL